MSRLRVLFVDDQIPDEEMDEKELEAQLRKRFPGTDPDTEGFRAGFLEMRLHDMRHCFCSRLAQLGVPLATIGILAGIAVGMPTLRASHHSSGAKAAYTVSFDGKKQKWFGVGVPGITTGRKDKLSFVWHKPWTRPERFEFNLSLANPPPAGWGRFFLEADYREFSSRRLDSMLQKGFSEDLLAKSILEPLRVRR